MKVNTLLAATAGFLLTSGCATMFGDEQQIISFQSYVPTQIILADDSGSRTLDTPDSTLIQKGQTRLSYQVKECGLQQNVNRRITPTFWLNIVSFPLGSGVDYLSGAMWEYDSNVNVNTNC